MNKKNKISNFYINGFSLHEILWYFIIFSIIGLLIETIYCYQTTGILESRKGLVFGPFCPIYGVGATFLIILLNNLKKHPIKLFIYGILIGSFLEYFLSFALECIYGTRFWDYSYLKIHLNGRIALTYSLFWGILSIFLIKILKPFIDKIFHKFMNTSTIYLDIIIFSFLVFDMFATMYSISVYKTRAINEYYNLPSKPYGRIEKFVNEHIFSNNYMKKSFPNLRFIDKDGNEIFIKNVFK